MMNLISLLPVWVLFTLLAAMMQAVRTAAQKRLREKSSIGLATAVRSFFGLPVALVFAVLIAPEAFNLSLFTQLSWRFWTEVALCAGFQLLATACLIHLFSLRNFAVGSLYSKIEIILTALIGLLFFSAYISFYGWLSIALATVGMVILTAAKSQSFAFYKLIKEPSALYGFISAVAFALTSLLSRSANQGLVAGSAQSGQPLSIVQSAVLVLLLVLMIQTLLSWLWLVFRRPKNQPRLPVVATISQNFMLCLFIGITSAIGSIGWFAAMALMNPAIVKVLGQVEMLFIYLIAVFVFKDRLSKLEWLGTLIVLASIVLLLLL